MLLLPNQGFDLDDDVDDIDLDDSGDDGDDDGDDDMFDFGEFVMSFLDFSLYLSIHY